MGRAATKPALCRERRGRRPRLGSEARGPERLARVRPAVWSPGSGQGGWGQAWAQKQLQGQVSLLRGPPRAKAENSRLGSAGENSFHRPYPELCN